MAGRDLHGRFVWHELMTSDPEDAQSFYTTVVGWGTQPFEGLDQPYTMWLNGEMPVGGVMELPEQAKAQGAPPHWLPYIGVGDVDAVTQRAKELGGSVLVPPTDIPNVGRFSVIQDPQGATFAAYASESEPPPAAEPQVGEFSWHELITTDPEAAFGFYSELFDWERTEAMDMGEMGTYQMYGQGGQSYGGIYKKPSEMPAPPHWLSYARVPKAQDAVEKVKKGGGQVLNGPLEVPGGGWVAQCVDAQGAAFAVHESGED